MNTILIMAGNHSQTLFLDTVRVDELAGGDVALANLRRAPHGNLLIAALALLSAYAASEPDAHASAAQDIVTAICLWTVKMSVPNEQFQEVRTALKMPGVSLCLTVAGKGARAKVAFDIVMLAPTGRAH